MNAIVSTEINAFYAAAPSEAAAGNGFVRSATNLVRYITDRFDLLQGIWRFGARLGDERPEKRQLILRICEYSKLEAGWDGYSGRPILIESIIEALMFLLKLPQNLPLPSPMANSDGLAGLFWEQGDVYVSIDFNGDGTYTYIADSADSETGDDHYRIDAAISKNILSALQKIQTS